MGILDRLSPTAQFIEVIEWLDDSSDTMLYRFPVRDQEIKNGAQLIVRESQTAVAGCMTATDEISRSFHLRSKC